MGLNTLAEVKHGRTLEVTLALDVALREKVDANFMSANLATRIGLAFAGFTTAERPHDSKSNRIDSRNS